MFWFSKICQHPYIPYMSHVPQNKLVFLLGQYRSIMIYDDGFVLSMCEICICVFYQSVAYYPMDSILVSEYESNIASMMELWSCSYFFSMMTSSNGNIVCVTGLLCGEFTDHRWIPLTKSSDAELFCFLWSALVQTMKTPVNWDFIAPIVTSL